MWFVELIKSKVFWICIGLVALVAVGWYVKGVFDERAQLKKERDELLAAHKLGQELQGTADQTETTWLSLLKKQKEEADGNKALLEQQLNAANHSLRACVLDAGTLRVLNRKQGTALAAAASGSGSRSAGVAADPSAAATVSCEDLAKSYDENRSVYEVTAAQVQQLRSFYKEVRAKYCAQTGAC